MSAKRITTILDVRVGDINHGGHLAHDRLITLLHQARCDFLAAFEASERDCFGVALIMRRITVEYLAEAFLGDRLEIVMMVSDIRPTGFLLTYQVLRGGTTVASATTLMVAFDYARRRVVRLPSPFATAVGAR